MSFSKGNDGSFEDEILSNLTTASLSTGNVLLSRDSNREVNPTHDRENTEESQVSQIDEPKMDIDKIIEDILNQKKKPKPKQEIQTMPRIRMEAKDLRLKELKAFAQTFKLATPMPEEIRSIMHLDEQKPNTSENDDKTQIYRRQNSEKKMPMYIPGLQSGTDFDQKDQQTQPDIKHVKSYSELSTLAGRESSLEPVDTIQESLFSMEESPPTGPEGDFEDMVMSMMQGKEGQSTLWTSSQPEPFISRESTPNVQPVQTNPGVVSGVPTTSFPPALQTVSPSYPANLQSSWYPRYDFYGQSPYSTSSYSGPFNNPSIQANSPQLVNATMLSIGPQFYLPAKQSKVVIKDPKGNVIDLETVSTNLEISKKAGAQSHAREPNLTPDLKTSEPGEMEHQSKVPASTSPPMYGQYSSETQEYGLGQQHKTPIQPWQLYQQLQQHYLLLKAQENELRQQLLRSYDSLWHPDQQPQISQNVYTTGLPSFPQQLKQQYAVLKAQENELRQRIDAYNARHLTDSRMGSQEELVPDQDILGQAVDDVKDTPSSENSPVKTEVESNLRFPESNADGNSSWDGGTNSYLTLSSKITRSTQATTISDAKSNNSTEVKYVPTGESILEEEEHPILDEVDGQSTISADSVIVLTNKQKEDIIGRFVESMLKDLSTKCFFSSNGQKINVSFHKRFQNLLKRYSIQVTSDATKRHNRQASKAIRMLRQEISTRCENALGGFTKPVKETRVYPTIIKEAAKFNPPEKTVTEKVLDWSQDADSETGSVVDVVIDLPQYENLIPETFEEEQVVLNEPIIDDMSLEDAVSFYQSTERSSISGNTEMVPLVDQEQEIYNYLTTHAAFGELLVEAQRLVEHYYGNQMELIRHRVLLGVRRPRLSRRSSDICEVSFELDWDLREFLLQQYDHGIQQDIGHILTVTGQSLDAQLTTVYEYLLQTWPAFPHTLLHALQNALTIEGTSTFDCRSDDLETSNMMVNLKQMSLRVTGSEELVITVAQQLGWLMAACRASTSGLSYAHVRMVEKDVSDTAVEPKFQYECTVVPLDLEETQGCWNNLVGNSVIATGFPIAPRPLGYVGLALSLEVMAGLAGVSLATKWEGGFVLKSRSTMFVPIARQKDSVQWHLVEKAHGRIKYHEIANLFPTRVLEDQLDEDALMSTNAYLGWCPESINNFGTQHYDHMAISYSKARSMPKKAISVSGASLGFAKIGAGSLQFSFGRKDGRFHADKSSFYELMLDDAKQIHVIIQDNEDRRAFQIDAERLILQIILHRHSIRSFKVNGQPVKLYAARADDPSSVREALLRNSETVLRRGREFKKEGITEQRFQDVVSEIFTKIEGLAEKSELLSQTSFELKIDKKRHILGWEYMDLAKDKRDFDPKETELRKSCGNWPEYARDIYSLILFGSGFRDIIQPKNSLSNGLCRNFKDLPKDKHYLAVEVATLNNLYLESGSARDQAQITSTGIRWSRSAHLFESCAKVKAKDGLCKCERIQEFVPKGSLMKVRYPGPLKNSGAVIFGQGSTIWKNGFANPWSTNRGIDLADNAVSLSQQFLDLDHTEAGKPDAIQHDYFTPVAHLAADMKTEIPTTRDRNGSSTMSSSSQISKLSNFSWSERSNSSNTTSLSIRSEISSSANTSRSSQFQEDAEKDKIFQHSITPMMDARNDIQATEAKGLRVTPRKISNDLYPLDEMDALRDEHWTPSPTLPAVPLQRPRAPLFGEIQPPLQSIQDCTDQRGPMSQKLTRGPSPESLDLGRQSSVSTAQRQPPRPHRPLSSSRSHSQVPNRLHNIPESYELYESSTKSPINPLLDLRFTAANKSQPSQPSVGSPISLSFLPRPQLSSTSFPAIFSAPSSFQKHKPLPLAFGSMPMVENDLNDLVQMPRLRRKDNFVFSKG